MLIKLLEDDGEYLETENDELMKVLNEISIFNDDLNKMIVSFVFGNKDENKCHRV